MSYFRLRNIIGKHLDLYDTLSSRLELHEEEWLLQLSNSWRKSVYAKSICDFAR